MLKLKFFHLPEKKLSKLTFLSQTLRHLFIYWRVSCISSDNQKSDCFAKSQRKVLHYFNIIHQLLLIQLVFNASQQILQCKLLRYTAILSTQSWDASSFAEQPTSVHYSNKGRVSNEGYISSAPYASQDHNQKGKKNQESMWQGKTLNARKV